MKRIVKYYSYDTSGNIVSEYKRVILNGSEESQTLVRYVRNTGGKAISMIQYDYSGQPSTIIGQRVYYFIYNGHGDVTALTDSTGTVVATYSYDEFGSQLSVNGQPSTVNEQGIYNPLRYSGAHNSYYDTETGLYKMGTRYYQPDVGRWLTRDAYEGEQQNPQGQNRYVYTENNPINSADPTGHWSKSIIKHLRKSKPGDVILTYYSGSYGFHTQGWTHAMMKVRPGKQYYDKVGSQYKHTTGKLRSRIAESNNEGKTGGDGSNIWALWPTFKRRDYDAIGIFRPISTSYKSKAISKMTEYSNKNIPFNWNSDYRSFNDGSNCAEIIFRAWKDASNGAINLNNQVHIIYGPHVLSPDTFVDYRYFTQIGTKVYK